MTHKYVYGIRLQQYAAVSLPPSAPKEWNSVSVRGIAEENAQIVGQGVFSSLLPLPTPAEVIRLPPLSSVSPPAPSPLSCPSPSSSAPSFDDIPRRFQTTELCIVNADTVSAGLALGPDTAVLSFANHLVPGGRYTHGGRAQEEDLCRLMPQLHPSLVSSSMSSSSSPSSSVSPYPLCSGVALLSRNMVVARRPHTYELLLKPKASSQKSNHGGKAEEGNLPTLTVITAAMPCGATDQGRPKGGWLSDDRDKNPWKVTVTQTIQTVLYAAAVSGHANLVLGAFGCGAFGNPTPAVAQIFRQVLASDSFRGFFQRVVFAIIDPLGTGNLKPFREALKDLV